VTWSDGSKQLLLGDEVLDIADLDNASANQFLFVRHHGSSVFIQVSPCPSPGNITCFVSSMTVATLGSGVGSTSQPNTKHSTLCQNGRVPRKIGNPRPMYKWRTTVATGTVC